MPFETVSVWRDEKEGPDAFKSVRMLNQRLWDRSPECVDDAICEALHTGSFGDGEISRRVGSYEGQIMAIRRGLVSMAPDGSVYEITESGRQFLRDKARTIPEWINVHDTSHKSEE